MPLTNSARQRAWHVSEKRLTPAPDPLTRGQSQNLREYSGYPARQQTGHRRQGSGEEQSRGRKITRVGLSSRTQAQLATLDYTHTLGVVGLGLKQ